MKKNTPIFFIWILLFANCKIKENKNLGNLEFDNEVFLKEKKKIEQQLNLLDLSNSKSHTEIRVYEGNMNNDTVQLIVLKKEDSLKWIVENYLINYSQLQNISYQKDTTIANKPLNGWENFNYNIEKIKLQDYLSDNKIPKYQYATSGSALTIESNLNGEYKIVRYQEPRTNTKNIEPIFIVQFLDWINYQFDIRLINTINQKQF